MDYIDQDIKKAVKAKAIGGVSEASKNYEYSNMSTEQQLSAEMTELMMMNKEAQDLENQFNNQTRRVIDTTQQNMRLLHAQGGQLNSVAQRND